MTGQPISPSIAALRKLEAVLHLQPNEGGAGDGGDGLRPRRPGRLGRFLRHRVLLRFIYGTGAVVVLLALACLGIWLRLLSGPIELDWKDTYAHFAHIRLNNHGIVEPHGRLTPR